MGTYTAIADVSETLIELLRDRMTERRGVIDTDRRSVVLASPNSVTGNSDVRLSLYLYSVTENGELNNKQPERVAQTTKASPPLVLDLNYLLTAYPSQGGADETARTKDQHSVLGLAIQVLNENAVIEGDDLTGSLVDDDQLRIHVKPRPMDEVARVWSTFEGQPLRPSVTYQISPVFIDSTEETEFVPVEERDTEYEQFDAADQDV